MKGIVLGLLAVLVAAPAFAGGVPPIPPNPTYSEPSQIIATLNALINQLNGNALGTGGYAAQPGGVVSLGSFCTASGATPQTCNASRGVVTTNSLATAASTAAAFVINDSLVTAQSACGASIGNTTSTGTPTVASVVTGAGTITVLVANVATATALNNTVNIVFNCIN